MKGKEDERLAVMRIIILPINAIKYPFLAN